MPLAKETKNEIIKGFKQHESDTGSAQVQVALLTERINRLTGHFKSNKRDHHSRVGLLKMVSQRRKLLSYLAKNDHKEYQSLVSKLDLRK